MAKLSIFIGKEVPSGIEEVDAEFAKGECDALDCRPIRGQVFIRPNLVELLNFADRGELFTTIDMRRYKITKLESDGKFTADPDGKW